MTALEMSDMLPELISVKEAARRAGVPRETLRDWLQAGSIPVKRIRYGRQYRVRVDELDAWLAIFRGNRDE
jgi:excisionase family DNA binding protein